MSKSNGGRTSTKATAPWEGQQPYLKDIFKQAQTYYNAPRPDLGNTGALVQAGVDSLRGAAGAVQPLATDALNANRNLVSGDLLSAGSNPALQSYIDSTNQQITNSFTQNVLPQLSSGALASGNIGSSRQGIAQGLAAGKTMDAVQRNTSLQASAAYAQGLKAYVAGTAMAPATGRFQMAPGNIYSQAGQNQFRVDNLQSNQELAYLQNYSQLLAGTYGGQTTASGPGTRTGGLSGALGGAALGYQAAGGSKGYGYYGAAAGAVAGYFS